MAAPVVYDMAVRRTRAIYVHQEGLKYQIMGESLRMALKWPFETEYLVQHPPCTRHFIEKETGIGEKVLAILRIDKGQQDTEEIWMEALDWSRSYPYGFGHSVISLSPSFLTCKARTVMPHSPRKNVLSKSH